MPSSAEVAAAQEIADAYYTLEAAIATNLATQSLANARAVNNANKTVHQKLAAAMDVMGITYVAPPASPSSTQITWAGGVNKPPAP